MATYEILIADDHPLFRSALHQAVTLELGVDVRLVEVGSIAELETQLTDKTDWDLVLLDLNMPGAYGFSGLVLLRGAVSADSGGDGVGPGRGRRGSALP
jgi:DNA-binding NarL/FixJ family response regulator